MLFAEPTFKILVLACGDICSASGDDTNVP